jgi:hypothetical protein
MGYCCRDVVVTAGGPGCGQLLEMHSAKVREVISGRVAVSRARTCLSLNASS